MAQGDFKFFNAFINAVGDKLHQLSTDTFKVGLTTGTTTPSNTTADPRWGAGGTTNFAAEEVTPGGNYTAGGASLGAADKWTEPSAGTFMFDGEDVSWAQHASNPTNARWGIVYNDTDAGKRAVGYLDLGSAINMANGALNVTWHGNGLGRFVRT